VGSLVLRQVHRSSAERAPVPAPVSSVHVSEVQVNTIRGDPEGIAEQFADLLRELPVQVVIQPADAA